MSTNDYGLPEHKIETEESLRSTLRRLQAALAANVQTDKDAEFLRQWILKCSKDSAPAEQHDELVVHIAKHFGPDMIRRVIGQKDWASWLASAFNLLEVFEQRALGRRVSVKERIEKFMSAWQRDPSYFCGPPAAVA